ncbi:MAG: EamA family transporter, partial [Anaerolineae bacterium]|nr:EamA family transporter [Anaerolineae bacterium]
SYALYLVLSKHLLRRYPPLAVIGWVYVFALPYLPFFMIGQKLLPDPGATTAWWSLAYVIVFPTVLAYLLN